jgi:hypothetical protein
MDNEMQNEQDDSSAGSNHPSVVAVGDEKEEQEEDQEKKEKEEESWEVDNRKIETYFAEAYRSPNHKEWLQRVNGALPGRFEPPMDGDDDGEAIEQVSDDEDDSMSDQEEEERDLGLPSWVSSISGAAFALFHHPGMHSKYSTSFFLAASLV